VSAYLDHAATTPVRREARHAVLEVLDAGLGNPSGAHRGARAARRILEEAREEVAAVLGARPGEVVFTSGGTEADNLAVLGRHDRVGGVLVCTAVEHHAVLDPVRSRGGRVVGVDARGVVDLDQLASALDDTVTLVSVMGVNNEIGVVQPLVEVAALVAAHAPRAVLHTDAVQAVAWLPAAATLAPAHLASVSGHKVGGPAGIGALVVRDGIDLAPRTLGGGQERGRRSGTQDVAGAAGLAAALRATAAELDATVTRVAARRDRLAAALAAAIDGLVETGVGADAGGGPDRSHKVAGSCHVCIPGVDSEALLFLLDQAGVAASAASSCASGALEPSHVLAALGIPDELARGSLRLSLGATTTDAEIDHAVAVIPEAVARLRRHAGG